MGATIAIRHQLDRSGNEGHGGKLQGGVQASTSGALQKIKRPAINHIHSSNSRTSRIGSKQRKINKEKEAHCPAEGLAFHD